MKNEITAKRIQLALSNANMKPQELADKSGVNKSSISQYVNGSHIPGNISAEKISKILNVDPLWLMGFDVNMAGIKETNIENDDVYSDILRKYRFISQYSINGTKMVDAVLDKEYMMAENRKNLEEEIKELKSCLGSEDVHTPAMRIINYYYRLASAGPGQIVFDTPPTKRIEIPDIPKYRKVDYAIGVNGDSMEPVYHDGDMLLVEMRDEIEVGEIGIFLVDGKSYVKKRGEKELISLNPKAENVSLTEDSRCMGKVIGKL